MAAATLVESPHHSPSIRSVFARPHARKNSRQSPFDPVLSPLRSARWLGDDDLSLGTTSQPSTSQSVRLQSSIDAPLTKPAPAVAKLKKKQHAKHVGRDQPRDQFTLEGSLCEPSFSVDANSSEAQPSSKPKAKHARSISKETYLKNLQKRFQDKDDDTSTVDLSLSIEENEKRSGLAISSHTQTPELGRDAVAPPHRDHAHNRSVSGTSFPQGEVYFGTPSVDFAQQTADESRSHSPLVNRHSFTELEWKLSPDAVDPRVAGLGIDSGIEPRQRAATFDAGGLPVANRSQAPTPSTRSATWDAATASASVGLARPNMRGKVSCGSSLKPSGNTSQSTLSLTKGGRSRRGTAQSCDGNPFTSPLSRSSTDRTFSFKRGFSSGSKETVALSEADRQAVVETARVQFKQKQEAKSRKYDEQERRSKEKKERKVEKQQDKIRRKSDASGRTRSKTFPQAKDRIAKRDVKPEEPPVVTGRTSPRRRDSSLDGVKFLHTERTPKTHQRPTSRTRSLGLLTWCKTHILRLRV